MREELPEGWAAIALRDLVECWGGMTPSTANPSYWGGRIPWISSKDVKSWHISGGTEFVTEMALAETRLRKCRPGTVLVVVRSGVLVHTLPVSIVDVGSVINQDIKALDSGDDALNEWLALYLHGNAQEILERNRKDGTTVQSIRVDELLDQQISIAPLAEQRSIITKIQALLAQVNAARGRLARVPLILKRFRQTVLAAACSGRLTEGWRNASPNSTSDASMRLPARDLTDNLGPLPECWKWVKFGDLVSSLRSGTTVPPQNDLTDFPVLRSSSVRPAVMDLTDIRYLRGEDSLNQDNYLQEGDLLFTRLSGSLEYVANCAIVRGLGRRRIQYPDRLFRARLRDQKWGSYIEHCFGSPTLRRSLSVASKSSAGHQRISMSALTEFWIPLAPDEEQAEIVRRVQALFSLADTIEKRVAAATARADKIPQAILSKAFSGELVPTEAELARTEGRSYETAEELLRRVSAEREAPAPKPTRGRPRRKTAT